MVKKYCLGGTGIIIYYYHYYYYHYIIIIILLTLILLFIIIITIIININIIIYYYYCCCCCYGYQMPPYQAIQPVSMVLEVSTIHHLSFPANHIVHKCSIIYLSGREPQLASSVTLKYIINVIMNVNNNTNKSNIIIIIIITLLLLFLCKTSKW